MLGTPRTTPYLLSVAGEWTPPRYLPGGGLPHTPVTLDIGGTVAVRARGPGHSPTPQATAGVELVLSGASRSGEPIRIQTDRRFLRRAASLGLTHIHLFGTQQSVLAWDACRRYVWAVLDACACIEPAETMTRIESPVPGRVASVDPPRSSIPRSTNPPMSRSSTTSTRNGTAQAAGNGHAKGSSTHGNGHARSDGETGQAAGAIEQGIALRAALREAAAQATELVRILKAEKRQTRQLRSALSSLRQLQSLDA